MEADYTGNKKGQKLILIRELRPALTYIQKLEIKSTAY